MDHMGNLGEILDQLLSTGDFSAEVFGTPNTELLNAISVRYKTYFLL
jgi:hypothetical protein